MFTNKRAKFKREKTSNYFKTQSTNVLWSITQNRMKRRHDARDRPQKILKIKKSEVKEKTCK